MNTCKDKIFMLDKRRWDILNSFELRQKERFLKKLTAEEGQRIFRNLYQFAQKINKTFYKQFNLRNTQALIKTHLIFMKVKA